MANKKDRMNEKELRREIQQKLEQEFQGRSGQESPSDSGKITGDQKTAQQLPSIDKQILRQQIEADIYGRHPEFVLCENHLGELCWFTTIELEEEFEFYPREESRWVRFKQIFSRSQPAIPEEPADIVNELRREIEQDAQKRLQEFLQKKEEIERQSRTDLEKKIYQEEMDRFYRGKRGYKKYENHLGETRWMTIEEFNAQEEFSEEEVSVSLIYLKKFLPVAALILVLAAIWFITGSDGTGNDKKAWLVVKQTGHRGNLYIDKNLAPGFKADEPYPVSAGNHEVSMIIDGFVTLPKKHLIDPQEGDTVRIEFDYQEHQQGRTGTIKIVSSQKDARVLVDGEFLGTVGSQKFITLPEGDHSVSIEKSSFVTSPRQHVFSLKANDTLSFVFKMNPNRKAQSRSTDSGNPGQGLIEVRSNIKNADIYLDGQKTTFQSDYVLQKIPYGKHIISLRKSGYTVYPEERIVKIGKKQKRSRVDFTLSSTTRPVTIETRPVAAAIFIDGREVGRGKFKGSLALGEHKIAFGEVDHYRTPEPQTVIINEQSPDILFFDYRLDFSLNFSPGKILPFSSAGYVSQGYLLEDNRFKNSRTNGPETRQSDKISQPVWNLGFAFQYKNPPGRDALVFSFDIPENIDLAQPLKLKLWIYRSKDNYPLILRGKAFYAIEINGRKFRKQVMPAYLEKDMGEAFFDEFKINEHLRPGGNKIMISTTSSTSAHVLLWKLAIQ